MAKRKVAEKVLKVIPLRATPERMENYSRALGRQIHVTVDTHRASRKKHSWRGLPILANHDETSTPLGVIADDGVVKPDGLYMSVAFTDQDALRIYESNAHKGWSIGFVPTAVNEETGEVMEYAPHHLAFVLPGHKPVCAKNVCGTVAGYTEQVAQFSFVEVTTMPEIPPTPPVEVAPHTHAIEGVPPVTTETSAAQTPAAPAPEATPTAAATKVEETPCACAGKEHAPAPAAAVPTPTKFTETEVFAMRDELAALKATREREMVELETLRQFRAGADQKEKATLIERITKIAGPKAATVDLNAKPIEALREMAAILPDEPAKFTETPTPLAADLTISGSGAKEHNKPPAVDPKEAKLLAERERIANLWKTVKA